LVFCVALCYIAVALYYKRCVLQWLGVLGVAIPKALKSFFDGTLSYGLQHFSP
jgi:hypothetical protein